MHSSITYRLQAICMKVCRCFSFCCVVLYSCLFFLYFFFFYHLVMKQSCSSPRSRRIPSIASPNVSSIRNHLRRHRNNPHGEEIVAGRSIERPGAGAADQVSTYEACDWRSIYDDSAFVRTVIKMYDTRRRRLSPSNGVANSGRAAVRSGATAAARPTPAG